MYPIFLLDDEQYYLDCISTILDNYILFHDNEFFIQYKTNSSRDLIQYLKKNPSENGLYFLDIDMKEEDSGISVGEYIKNEDPTGKIVFITGYPEYAPLTLEKKLEPLDIIKKNENDLEHLRDSIIEVLEIFYRRMNYSSNFYDNRIKIKSGTSTYMISREDFYFMSTTKIPHQLIFFTKYGHYHSYSSLKEYEHEYKYLLRVSKSVIINPDKILKIDYANRVITLANEFEINFAGNRQKKIKDFFEFELS